MGDGVKVGVAGGLVVGEAVDLGGSSLPPHPAATRNAKKTINNGMYWGA